MMSNLNENDIAIILDDMEYLDYKCEDGCWKALVDDKIPMTTDGRSVPDWRPVLCHEVPVKYLLETYHCMIVELTHKETKYMELKEQYNSKEFEIVYMSDIDFKELYGSTSEKVRKQHANTVLKKLKTEINNLELSIDWLKRYISFLKELIRTKRMGVEE